MKDHRLYWTMGAALLMGLLVKAHEYGWAVMLFAFMFFAKLDEMTDNQRR